MLIISNGSYKSGSTWLYNIIKTIVEPLPIPQEICDTGFKHPSIRFEKILEFAESIPDELVYVSKNHLPPEKLSILLSGSKGNIKVLSISRNLEDAILSAWHHWCHEFSYNCCFQDYYWSSGRYAAMGIIQCNAYFEQLEKPWATTIQYESLLKEPNCNIKKLIEFLGDLCKNTDIDAIISLNNFESLRQKYQDKDVINGKAFFRKGVAGEGAKFFNFTMRKDLKTLIYYKGVEPLEVRFNPLIVLRRLISKYIISRKIG